MRVLFDRLEETLNKIREMKPETGLPTSIMSGLRELQRSVNPLRLASVDQRTRFIAFFLSSYVDSIFMDLLGDIPDDPDGVLEAIRKEFFGNVVDGFSQLLKALSGSENPLPALESLVDSYAKAVRELNYKDIQIGGLT